MVYPLERGDLVQITVAELGAAAVACRVIGYKKEWFADAIDLRAVEVLT